MTRRSILVIEDDLEIQSLLETILNLEGYDVQKATNGKEALALLEASLPELIILDMKMPVMNGWEFARRFQKKFGRSVPILVMTAAGDAAKSAAEIGAAGYLAKPFEIDELLERIHALGKAA